MEPKEKSPPGEKSSNPVRAEHALVVAEVESVSVSESVSSAGTKQNAEWNSTPILDFDDALLDLSDLHISSSNNIVNGADGGKCHSIEDKETVNSEVDGPGSQNTGSQIACEAEALSGLDLNELLAKLDLESKIHQTKPLWLNAQSEPQAPVYSLPKMTNQPMFVFKAKSVPQTQNRRIPGPRPSYPNDSMQEKNTETAQEGSITSDITASGLSWSDKIIIEFLRSLTMRKAPDQDSEDWGYRWRRSVRNSGKAKSRRRLFSPEKVSKETVEKIRAMFDREKPSRALERSCSVGDLTNQPIESSLVFAQSKTSEPTPLPESASDD